MGHICSREGLDERVYPCRHDRSAKRKRDAQGYSFRNHRVKRKVLYWSDKDVIAELTRLKQASISLAMKTSKLSGPDPGSVGVHLFLSIVSFIKPFYSLPISMKAVRFFFYHTSINITC